MRYYILPGIKLPFTASDGEILDSATRTLSGKGIKNISSITVWRKSLDARRKDAILYVTSVLVVIDGEISESKQKILSLTEVSDPYADFAVECGSERAEYPPLVVGMGPAGLFAALTLARHGYCPTIIDRGGSVDERVSAVEMFKKERVLDTETNIQFGAGGAGTFSDGKLVTRVKDKDTSYVLKTLVDFGAGEDIMTSAKPHIGTDVLRSVVCGILNEIERLGGRVIYNCRLNGISERSDCITGITTEGEISASAMVLAIGHSSRDTYDYLLRSGFELVPKPFSVGVRIEHLRRDVEYSLYGKHAEDKRLPHGEYALSDTKGERGVYTFCMCPGGYITASSSEEGCVVTNGMSERARDGANSNSAMLVSVSPEDFGNNIRKAIEFQRKLERDAFLLGGGDYSAPVLTVGDFKARVCKTEPSKIVPTYMDGGVKLAPIYDKMPAFLYDGLSRGLESFEKKLYCFGDDLAVMTGFETRTSAPLRMPRSGDFTAVGHDRLYPAGEGAGYAGGITSAALDGLHIAEKIIRRFAPRVV